MERSTVIGKFLKFSSLKSQVSSLRENRKPKTEGRAQAGFSLLEMMIAMFILIILLSVALPAYQRTVQHAKETVLKENLWQMRRAIDQYTADKGKLPQSVAQLVDDKYLHEKPLDPISEKREWNEIMGEDNNSADGGQGLTNVKSLAEGTDSDGNSYDSEAY
jgi:general secretion pathway protein G